ncbi:MAG: hypothetical protein LBH42_02410 [Treponema sp.]|jgi:hypothetical protein|nr:hypothetical protein [Treponema sp.]
MHVREKYYDEVFNFSGQWDMPSCCGLKILRREKTIVIVTELYQDNPGTSVTAAGKSLADQICREKHFCLDEILYIECNPGTDSKLSFYDEEFFEVDFSGGAVPAYRQLGAMEIKKLFPERKD